MSAPPAPSAIFIQAGARGELTELEAGETAMATLLALRQPGAVVHWFVDGYDDDPRPLWEIPEVAAQIRRAAAMAQFTDGYKLLVDRLDDGLITLLALCGCFPRGHPFEITVT